MTTICVFVLAGLAWIATAQDPCTAPINTYIQQVKAAEDAAKASFQQLKQQGEACFRSNECQVPKLPHGGEERGRGGEHGEEGKGHKLNATEVALRNATRQCEKAIHQNIEQQVDQCVQTKTGLTISNLAGGHKSFHQGGGRP